MKAVVALGMSCALVSGGVGEQTAPYAGEIRERLGKPIIATFESRKPAYDLELCVADVMSVVGVPTVLRDGPDNIQMMVQLAPGNVYLASVSFTKVVAGTRLDVRVRGKGWDDRLKERISRCL